MKRRALFAGIALLLLVVPRPAQAVPILGASVFATGAAVTAVYLGESAAFTHDLYVFAASDLTTPLPVTGVVGPGYLSPGVIFTTDEVFDPGDTVPLNTPGDMVPLAFAFVPGDELVFGIYVRDTGFTYFTGPAGRNPDGLAHAVVDFAPPLIAPPPFPPIPIPPGLTLVGFEDIFGGGDLDFDDLGFAFTAVSAVPEPTSLLLLGTGAAGLLARARRRRK